MTNSAVFPEGDRALSIRPTPRRRMRSPTKSIHLKRLVAYMMKPAIIPKMVRARDWVELK